MLLLKPLGAVLTVCALAACGGGSADSNVSPTPAPTPSPSPSPNPSPSPGGGMVLSNATFSCSPLGGGNASLSRSCVYCPQGSVSDAENAIDLNLDAPAAISFFNSDVAQQQTVFALRATAQSGTVFAAGGKAGVAFQKPEGSNATYNVRVATYLSGSLQETSPLVTSTGPSNGANIYVGFSASAPTTKVFDAIELQINETNPTIEKHTYNAFEYCSDGQLK